MFVCFVSWPWLSVFGSADILTGKVTQWSTVITVLNLNVKLKFCQNNIANPHLPKNNFETVRHEKLSESILELLNY